MAILACISTVVMLVTRLWLSGNSFGIPFHQIESILFFFLAAFNFDTSFLLNAFVCAPTVFCPLFISCAACLSSSETFNLAGKLSPFNILIKWASKSSFPAVAVSMKEFNSAAFISSSAFKFSKVFKKFSRAPNSAVAMCDSFIVLPTSSAIWSRSSCTACNF